MTTLQLSFLPDNDIEPQVKKPSAPAAKLINGHWCWLKFGTDEYVYEPELEAILLAALAKQQRKAA